MHTKHTRKHSYKQTEIDRERDRGREKQRTHAHRTHTRPTDLQKLGLFWRRAGPRGAARVGVWVCVRVFKSEEERDRERKQRPTRSM